MRRKRMVAALLCALLTITGCAQGTEPVQDADRGEERSEREKVILDTDMVDLFDDGLTMLMLAKSDKIDLLGVTCVAGNSWVEAGVASAVRQLELAGIDGISVLAGIDQPTRTERLERMDQERIEQNIDETTFVGSFAEEKPSDWKATYRAMYGEDPTSEIADETAVDFIIRTVKENPGEITIAAIGPCMNLAAAAEQAPEIVPLIKQVIYMGGAYHVPGNISPAAEFNVWYDPESARIAYRTPFPKQVMIGLDATDQVVFDEAHGETVTSLMERTPFCELWENHWIYQCFAQEEGFTGYIWDLLVAVALIEPDSITGTVECQVDVDDTYGPQYGKTTAYSTEERDDLQTVTLVTEVDDAVVWKEIEALIASLRD